MVAECQRGKRVGLFEEMRVEAQSIPSLDLEHFQRIDCSPFHKVLNTRVQGVKQRSFREVSPQAKTSKPC